MLHKKLAAGALSAVLAASLCPGLALAQPLAGGTIADDSESATALSTESTSVWVVSRISYSYSGSSYKSSTSKTYSYNGNGLLKQTYRSYSSSGSSSYSYSTTQALTYKGNNLSKIKTTNWYSGQTSSSTPTVYTFKCKNGHVVKATIKYNSGNNSSKNVYTYKRNSAGGAKSYSSAYYSYRNNDGSYSKKMKKRSSTTYTLSKFKGFRPGKSVYKSKSSGGGTTISAPTTYSYDKKSNLKRMRQGNYTPTIYQYTYNGNRVATRTYGTSTSSGTVYHYTWKKVSVPSALVSKVKAQQWSIVNNNLNYAFGPVGMGI